MNRKAITFLILAIAILVVMCVTRVGYEVVTAMRNNRPVILQRSVMHPRQFRDQYVDRSVPEIRPPPYKKWRPSLYQQLGILTSEDGKILPLYGKESNVYRNRWNYYTSTPGNQIYSLPIKSGDRDCTEDIGCNELYGSEELSVTGMADKYKAEIYKNTI